MEDRTGDPGKGVTRAKGKMRETMMDGLEAGRGGDGRNWHQLRGALHTEAPCPFPSPPPGISAFPCCGKDSVDIVERK